jgi:hypothetical protein
MDDSKILADCKQDELQRTSLIASLSRKVVSTVRERSLAKTTKLVNRLKRFHLETNVDQILNDLSKLDLSMYIEEVVSSLIEAYRAMRLRDLNTLLTIVCDLQACYPQLGEKFIESHRKCLDSVINDNLRVRIYLRVLTEFSLLAISEAEASVELEDLIKTLLTFTPQTISGEILATRLNAIVYWVSRYHGVCLGHPTITGTGVRELVVSVCKFSDSARSDIESHISTFFHKKLPGFVNHTKALIENQERRHDALMINKGVVDQESEAKYESMKADLEKLESAQKTIGRIMGYQTEEPEEEIEQEIQVTVEEGPTTPTPEELQFTDDTERSFYLDLIDLSSRLPSAFLENKKSSTKVLEDNFVDRLRSITLPDDADKLAIEFFESGYNSDANLHKIQTAFFGGQPGSVDPVHLRFLATVARYVPHEFTELLVDDLRRQAKLPGKPGSDSLVQLTALKNLSELCKFGTCPPGVIIKLLRRFLDDFDAHNAEMASWILVGCGRYLVIKPEVAELMEEQITRLMKLRNSSTIHLPRRIEIMVDHAYYTAKPRNDTRPRSNRVVREKSVLEKYAEHLVHVEVYRMHEDQVLRLVRKLPWTDQVVLTLKEAILDLKMHSNFEKCFCVTSLLAGLIKFHESFVVEIIDNLFEQFQIALEKEDFRQAPYRVRLAKLIAELYVFKLIDANTVFDLLFQLIGFRDTSCYGASEHTLLLALWDETDGALKHPAAMDEPNWSHVRINLISTILRTCGEFFVTGRNKIKLKRFLLCLRRYIAVRAPHMPSEDLAEVQNIVSDLFEFLEVGKIDLRKDTVEKIDSELRVVVETIRTAPSAAHTVVEESDSEGVSTPQGEEEEEVEEDEMTSSDEDAYQRETRGGELMDFDKELQAMMVESITEAKNFSKPTSASVLQKAVPKIVVSSGSPSSEDEGDSGPQAGTFKVLLRSKHSSVTPRKSSRTILVPETNKLNQSQEKYRAELEAAQREKQAIKRFIMDYQWREERQSVQPQSNAVNATGGRPVAPTLAMAAGLTPDATTVPTRRKYRKL